MHPTIPQPARDIPLLGDYDVVVCGGGPAGCAAAIAAARRGASVLLIERLAQMGGLGTSGLVCHWLGGRSNDTRQWVVGGIFRELVEAAVAAGVAVLPRADDFADLPYTPIRRKQASPMPPWISRPCRKICGAKAPSWKCHERNLSVNRRQPRRICP